MTKGIPLNFKLLEMPSIKSNIPYVIFYSSTMSEYSRIAKSILYLKDFLPVAKNLLDWMTSQGGSNQLPLKQNKKVFNRHPESFQKYHNMASDIASKTAAT